MSTSIYRDWLARNPAPSATVGPSSREDDAVLACAVGCDLAEVAPFVRSLRSVFPGQVIIVIDRKPTLQAWLSTHGVETVIVGDRSPHWKSPAIVARFAVYARILQERREIRNVILADVRDVVFQSDPFRATPDDLHFFTGAGGPLTDPSRGRNAEALVGADLARDLCKRARIADVVAGPNEAVTRFCHALLLLCGQPRASLGIGADRAACHIVAHLGLAGGEIRPNFQRVAIASFGMRVGDGRILNPDDSTSPIVLGYRRSSDLALHIDRRWGVPPARVRETGLRRTMRTLQASFLGGPPAPR